MELVSPNRSTVTIGLVLTLMLAIGPASVRSQAKAAKPSILQELRQIGEARDHSRAGDLEHLVKAATRYLETFSAGRYRDEALLLLADGLRGNQHPDEAVTRYGELIDGYADSPFREAAMAAVQRLHADAGRRAEAQAMRERLFEEYPNSSYASQILLSDAEEKFERGDMKGSLSLLSTINPSALSRHQQGDLYRMSVLAYTWLGDDQRASLLLKRFLGMDDAAKRKAAVLIQLGEAARKTNRPQVALRHYGTVLKSYAVGDAIDEAMFWSAVLTRPPETQPADESTSDSRLEESLALFDAYLDRQYPLRLADALENRAAIYAQLKRFPQALADYEWLDSVVPPAQQSPNVLLKRSAVLGALDRSEEAIPLLMAGAANVTISGEDRAALRLEMSDIRYRQGDCGSVVKILRPMPVFAGRDAQMQALFLRGVCHHQLGKHDRAALDLEGLLQEPQYLAVIWSTLLDAYEASGQDARVVTLGQDLLMTGRLQVSLGLTKRILHSYEKLDEPGMGLAFLRRLEEQEPESMSTGEMRVVIGRMEAAHGDRGRAETMLSAVLEEAGAIDGSGPPDYYYDAGKAVLDLYIANGDYESAAALAGRATEVADSAQSRAHVREWLGVAYAAWGTHVFGGEQPARAEDMLRIALAFLPQSPPERRAKVVDALARLISRDGNHALAAQHYQREIIGADTPEYRGRLAQGLQALYLEWAESAKKEGNLDEAIAQYAKLLKEIPKKNWRERYKIIGQVDTLYQAGGAYKKRVALYGDFRKSLPQGELREQLRLYQSQLYREWGDNELKRNRRSSAIRRYRSGLALLKPGEGRWRYDLVMAVGRIYESLKKFTDLVLFYEGERARSDVQSNNARLESELGRVYILWAQNAVESKNAKSARIRYYYALDHLPAAAWENRLTATVPLARLLVKDGKQTQAAGLYAKIVPQIGDPRTRQRYALYLGRVYKEKVKKRDRAVVWFTMAARGPDLTDRIEAEYLLSDLDLNRKKPLNALKRLQALSEAEVQETPWAVPINYRLAVLYHGEKNLKLAMRHYRVVAGVKSKKSRKLYRRFIAQSREQIDAISTYLRHRGSSSNVSVPKVGPGR